MENQLRIRDAKEDERNIIRDIVMAAYAEFQAMVPPRFWARYKQHIIESLDGEGNYERIVAEQNGSIIGSVLLYPPEANAYASTAMSTSYPEVRFLAVLPEARGRGIGNALMNECERRAREQGAKAIGLHTMDAMRAAIRMYERMGFVRTPETDFRSSEEIVVVGYRHNL